MKMLWLSFVFFIIFAISGVSSKGCTVFHYDGPDGQKDWGSHYNQCAGKHQSPIDIDSIFVTMAILSPLQTEGFASTVGNASLINNGHTAMMTINSNKMPTLSGGPLNGIYEFAQLHFHWGANDTIGSEDTIDGKSFPLELHIVFYKKEYLGVDSAMNYTDGLCVLACVYEVVDKNNDKYNSFVKLLPKVIKPALKPVMFPKAPALFDLLPSDLSQYFTYHGSLTTPPCAESVTWIDFRETIKIKSCQLAAFRNLVDEEGEKLINNFRAVQPLGDRIVRRNIANTMDTNLNNNRKVAKNDKNTMNKMMTGFNNIPPPPPAVVKANQKN